MLNQAFSTGATTPPRLQIGEWRANRTTNELGRAGDTVRIEPRVMEVLMVLADRAGEVVSRDDLLAAVWPGVVVGDDALTQSIIKLRKALGDNPRSPSYIETISKRGYRLIAPVVRNDAVPATYDERVPARTAIAGFIPSSASVRWGWLRAWRWFWWRPVSISSAHDRSHCQFRTLAPMPPTRTRPGC